MNDNTLSDSSLNAQILLKLGEMGTDLAVIKAKLETLPDHESRIRALERWKYSLPIALLLAIGSTAITIASLIRT